MNFKPAAALLIVTLLAAFALGVVYETTLEPIAEQKRKTEAETVAQLLPGTDETASEDVTAKDSLVTKVTTCRANGALIGYAVSVAPKGYGGSIEMMVGFDTQGVIQGVQILSHAETPGLGANAAQPSFTGQYKGKSGQLTVTKVKGSSKPEEVEAIVSATITSNAVTAGVNAASTYFETTLKAGVNP